MGLRPSGRARKRPLLLPHLSPHLPPAAPPPLPDQTVWVIDAHSLIHQVFHALPEMTSPQGEPMGAVYGFSRDLFYLLEDKRPDYLFCELICRA